MMKPENEKGVRINKYLSEAGICSRREADRLVAERKVKIDSIVATAGMRVYEGQRVYFEGELITNSGIDKIYIAYNKPRGITCTTDRTIKSNIIDAVKCDTKIFPVGRLDRDSEGLIFLTNDGDIVNKILRSGNNHEKEYVVKVDREFDNEFLSRMSDGVPILGTTTKSCLIKRINSDTFRIILTQGMNRQIRRMCEYLGYNVLELRRVRIMNVNIGNLKTNKWRMLSNHELSVLRCLTAESSDLPTEELEYDE